MKYLDPKFSSPANSRAYVEGWERCFGEGEGEAKTEEEVVVVEGEGVSEEGCKVEAE